MATITQLSYATDLSSLTGTKVKNTSSSSDLTNKAADQAKELKNQFLSILLTQMQHQNPLDPMDTKEFTGQLAQFSSLEQQISTNVKLDNLLGSLQQTAVASSFGYIGQYVDLDTNAGSMQDGSATWTYAIPEEAKDVTITIRDNNGKVVYSGALQNGSGSSTINAGTYGFTLTDADTASAVPDGTVLNFSITAKNGKGKPITTDIHSTVHVDSIQSDSSATYLQAGGLLFEIADIQKIVSSPNTSTPTTTENTSV
ncbi:MAG TPA: flagellar hook capping FlgD N-terminal domain-containing protein [Alphaproteobacteria bacterium]|jgi:flagellar basal-body rod modification protein FlgD|nr:hypothetical protein [Alphaproteobacteria bacterium]HRK96951.1 flagellar hook capping FlgD N-terminal domain-containing protein [Alphaproteobacteria bacterium]